MPAPKLVKSALVVTFLAAASTAAAQQGGQPLSPPPPQPLPPGGDPGTPQDTGQPPQPGQASQPGQVPQPGTTAGTGQPQQVPEEARRLQRLVGSWRGSGTARVEGRDYPVSATWSCEQGAGGFSVQCDFMMSGVPGMDPYMQTDLIAWSAGDRLVHWYSVSGSGEARERMGSWSGEGFVVTHSGAQSGQMLTDRIQLSFAGPRQIRGSSTTSIGDRAGMSLDLTMNKIR